MYSCVENWIVSLGGLGVSRTTHMFHTYNIQPMYYMCRTIYVKQFVYSTHVYNMCITHVSATHVIHLYFCSCNAPKSTIHFGWVRCFIILLMVSIIYRFLTHIFKDPFNFKSCFGHCLGILSHCLVFSRLRL